jgi:hypothetical protein
MEMRNRSQDIRYLSKNRWDRRTGDVLNRLLHNMQNARNSRNSGEEHAVFCIVFFTCGKCREQQKQWGSRNL